MASLLVAEKFELGAIVLITGLVACFAPLSGINAELGELTAGTALLILLQGLFRDLWLLYQSRRSKSAVPNQSVRCMCVESAMGLTGIVTGVALVGLGLANPIHVGTAALTVGVASALVAGFLLKDFVFQWSPWKIYREKNHAQVIFRWRK